MEEAGDGVIGYPIRISDIAPCNAISNLLIFHTAFHVKHGSLRLAESTFVATFALSSTIVIG
jgi:hypothetical protein